MRRLRPTVPILFGLALLAIFGLLLPESGSFGASYTSAALLGLLASFEAVRLVRGRDWRMRLLLPGAAAVTLGIVLHLLHGSFEGVGTAAQVLRHVGIATAVAVWTSTTWIACLELWEPPKRKRAWVILLLGFLALALILSRADHFFIFLAAFLFFSIGLSWRRLRMVAPVPLAAVVMTSAVFLFTGLGSGEIGATLLVPSAYHSNDIMLVNRLAVSLVEGARMLVRTLALCFLIYGVWHWTGELLFGSGRVRAKLLGSYLLTAIAPLVIFMAIFGLALYIFTITYRSTLTRKLLVAEEHNFEKWVSALSVRRNFWESLKNDKGAEKHLPLALLDMYPDAVFDVLQTDSPPSDSLPVYTRVGAPQDTFLMPRDYATGGICFGQQGKDFCMFVLLPSENYVMRAWVPITPEFLRKTKTLSGTDININPSIQIRSRPDRGLSINMSSDSGFTVGGDLVNKDQAVAQKSKAINTETPTRTKSWLDTRIAAGWNVLEGVNWETGHKTTFAYQLSFTPRMIYEDLFNPSEPINLAIRAAFVFLCGVFLVFMFAISWLGWRVAGGINTSVRSLEKGVQELRAGHLNYELPVQGGAEFRQVAESFNMLTRDIRRMLRDLSEKERIEGELTLARAIQRALLPQKIPDLGSVQIAARSQPAKEVGGDYYDILELGDGKFMLAVGDVSGKGFASALVMARTQSTLRSLARSEVDLKKMMSALNRAVCDGAHPGMFVSLFVAILDPKNRQLEFVNGGHDFPLLCRNGKVERLETGGVILGVFPDAEYESETLDVKDSACLLVYTDGLAETKDEKDFEFGPEGLSRILHSKMSCKGANEILDRVFTAVEEYANGDPAADDRTAMVLVFS